jgi:hypothetical protein
LPWTARASEVPVLGKWPRPSDGVKKAFSRKGAEAQRNARKIKQIFFATLRLGVRIAFLYSFGGDVFRPLESHKHLSRKAIALVGREIPEVAFPPSGIAIWNNGNYMTRLTESAFHPAWPHRARRAPASGPQAAFCVSPQTLVTCLLAGTPYKSERLFPAAGTLQGAACWLTSN